MKAIFVSVRVKPDQRERFLQVIEDDQICSLRDEPGCVRFNVLQDEADQNRFHFYEVYKDEQALDAHTKTPHFARWRAAVTDVLDGEPERVRADTVFPRGDWHK